MKQVICTIFIIMALVFNVNTVSAYEELKINDFQSKIYMQGIDLKEEDDASISVMKPVNDFVNVDLRSDLNNLNMPDDSDNQAMLDNLNTDDIELNN